MIKDIEIAKPLYDAMCIDTYSSGNTDYTPSNMLIGTKEYHAKKRSEEMEPSVSTSFASFRGNLIHKGLEEYIKLYKGEGSYETEVHVEVSFNKNSKRQLIEDKIIGGTIDILYTYPDGTVVLADYKTMNTVNFIDNKKLKEYTEKANIYVWCLRKAGYKIDKVVFIPIFIDWNYARYMRSNKEDLPTLSVSIDIWNEDKAEEFIYNRITSIEKFKDIALEDIPICSKEERWYKKKEFKVGKLVVDKVPKALPKCTFDTQEEAVEEMNKRNAKGLNTGIKVVGGESTKCLSYCSFRHVCKWNELEEK